MTITRPHGSRSEARILLVVAAVAAAGTVAASLLGPVLAVGTIAGIVLIVAIIEEPSIGALVIAAFAILRLSDVATEFHGAPTTFTPVIALIVLALAARALRTGERPTGGGRAAVVVGALAAVALISLPSAAHFDTGLRAVVTLIKDGSVAILIGLLLTSATTVRRVVWVLLAGGLFLTSLSLIQFATGTFGSSFAGFAQSRLQQIAGSLDDIRISGPVGDPNFYAQWLVLLIPLALDRFHDESSAVLRWAAAAVAAMSTAVIVITFSRGALLALAVVLGLMALRHPPRATTIAAVLAIGLLSLPFLPEGYVARMTALADIGGADIGTDPSLRAREAEAAVATQMFFEDPLTGVGYGTYQANYLDYARDLGLEQVAKPREAHNLYLETAAETGIPGIVVLGFVVAAVGAALASGRRMFRAMGDHRVDGIGYAIGVALIGYLVSSVFLHMAFTRPMWVLVGIALALPSIARAENSRRDLALEAVR